MLRSKSVAAVQAMKESDLPSMTGQGFRLQEVACMCLYQLACSDADDLKVSNERRQYVAEAGAFPAIVKAMSVFGTATTQVGKAGCMAIYNICGGSRYRHESPGAEAIREAAAKAGAIEAATEYMTNHAQCSQCRKELLLPRSKRTHRCHVPPSHWRANAEAGLKAIHNICNVSRKADDTPASEADAQAASKRAHRCDEAGTMEAIDAIAETHKKDPTISAWVHHVGVAVGQCRSAGASAEARLQASYFVEV